MAREIELKFIGSGAALEKLRRSAWMKALTKGRVRTATLRSTYFDTTKQDLSAHGISFRIRKDGSKLTQTIKSLNGKSAPRWDRAEQDAKVTDLVPKVDLIQNDHLRKALTDWQERGELGAVFETEFRRSALPLNSSKGIEIEAAFDVGTIRALGHRNGVSMPFAELELELKKGDVAQLFELARRVIRTSPLRFAIETKADRGYALMQGTGDKAVRAKPLTLDKDMRSDDAFAMILGEGLKQIISNENSILRARDVEGVHQMRVAIRRLRSAISAFGKAYDHGEMARLKSEMKWLANGLGITRDWDVFQDRILKPVASEFSKDGGLFALVAATRRARRESWDETLELLESERYRLLIVDIAAAISGRIWHDPTIVSAAKSAGKITPYDRPVVRTARKCLDKRLAQAVKLGNQIEELSAQQRHELRIDLKRLRYAADFLASCFPEKPTRRYLARLSGLQNIFGELNDVAVAQGLIARLASQANADGDVLENDLARAGGMVMGWHMALSVELWATARKRWDRFADTKVFWR